VRKENLILFTNGFPCVKEGEEFLEAELKLLSSEFRSIIIYVLNKGEICRSIPSNAKVKFLKADPDLKVRNVLLKHGLTLLKIQKEDKKDPVAKTVISKNKTFYKNVLIGNFLLKQTLERELKSVDLKQTKLYSYWCGPWFDILMLMNKNITNIITFRAHGYDFDVEQRPDKYIPYRNYLIKKQPFISFISQFGYDTYTKKYPEFTNKKMNRLGVVEQSLNVQRETKEFTIVSCSSLITLKRIHLIIDVLKNISLDIKWIHFGDGPLMKEIKEKAKTLNSNISTEFKGYVSHGELMNYYKNNQVDLVMNASELEGIPVSLMEAISFGIPVTGCKICGVPEIVTPETGFLWEKDFDTKLAARQLTDYFQKPIEQKQKFREGVKNFWNQYFNAEKNYRAFIKNCLLN
jgi:glycosyltransferase involved in cell wall biosynthesis